MWSLVLAHALIRRHGEPASLVETESRVGGCSNLCVRASGAPDGAFLRRFAAKGKETGKCAFQFGSAYPLRPSQLYQPVCALDLPELAHAQQRARALVTTVGSRVAEAEREVPAWDAVVDGLEAELTPEQRSEAVGAALSGASVRLKAAPTAAAWGFQRAPAKRWSDARRQAQGWREHLAAARERQRTLISHESREEVAANTICSVALGSALRKAVFASPRLFARDPDDRLSPLPELYRTARARHVQALDCCLSLHGIYAAERSVPADEHEAVTPWTQWDAPVLVAEPAAEPAEEEEADEFSGFDTLDLSLLQTFPSAWNPYDEEEEEEAWTGDGWEADAGDNNSEDTVEAVAAPAGATEGRGLTPYTAPPVAVQFAGSSLRKAPAGWPEESRCDVG